MSLEITATTLNKLLKSDKFVVIYFWSEGLSMNPLIEYLTLKFLAFKYKDRVVVKKMKIDNNRDTTSKYCIRSIPLILFFKNGKVEDKLIGEVQKASLVEKIDKLLVSV